MWRATVAATEPKGTFPPYFVPRHYCTPQPAAYLPLPLYLPSPEPYPLPCVTSAASSQVRSQSHAMVFFGLVLANGRGRIGWGARRENRLPGREAMPKGDRPKR